MREFEIMQASDMRLLAETKRKEKQEKIKKFAELLLPNIMGNIKKKAEEGSFQHKVNISNKECEEAMKILNPRLKEAGYKVNYSDVDEIVIMW